MKIGTFIVVFGVLSLGCGSDSSKKSKDPMVGLWILEKSYSDFEVLNIRGDGTYRYTFGTSSGNEYEMEQTDGDVVYDGAKLTLTPKRSTCKSREPQIFDYSQEGDNLNLTVGAKRSMFVRSVEDDSGSSDMSGTITTGCFDSETGEFTARAWSDL